MRTPKDETQGRDELSIDSLIEPLTNHFRAEPEHVQFSNRLQSVVFPFVHDLIDRVRPGALYAIGARASVGKTSFALNIADRCIDEGIGTVFLSLEAADLQQHLHRLLCLRTGASTRKARLGWLSEDEILRLKQTRTQLHSLPLYFLDPGWPPPLDSVLCELWRCIQEQQCRVFIVDHLQLLSSKWLFGRAVKGGVRLVLDALKWLASETQTVGLIVSQLSQPSPKHLDPMPGVADLRGGKALAAYFEGIIMLHRAISSGLSLRRPDEFRELLVTCYSRPEFKKIGPTRLLFNVETGKIIEEPELDASAWSTLGHEFAGEKEDIPF